MSFSSTFSNDSSRKTRSSATLSEALVYLGFEPARTESFDWMEAYSDASHFLKALKTQFHPESVLTTTEAEKFARAALQGANLESDSLVEAARPISNAPSVKSVSSAREERLQSARRRVNLLQAQKEVLQDALRRKRERGVQTDVVAENRGPTGIAQEVDNLVSVKEGLNEHFLQRPERFSELAFLSYCQKEVDHCGDIADVARESFPEDLKTAFDPEATMSRDTKRAVGCFAELSAQKCMYQSLLIRDAAILSSLKTDDGKYLEMTSSSMISLIKELRQSAIKDMRAKANHISVAGREALWNDVNIHSFFERERQQDAYATAMRQWILLYLRQRVRISFAEGHIQRVVTRKNTLISTMREVNPRVPCLSGLDEVSMSDVAPKTKDFESAEGAAIENNELSHELGAGHFSAKYETEETTFLSNIEATALQITCLQERNAEFDGTSHESSNMQVPALLAKLEEYLRENTVLLDALITKKSAILDRATQSSQSPSGATSWVRNVNATSSPTLSSNSSSSSVFSHQ